MAIACNTEAFISSVRRLAKINSVDNGSFPTDADIIAIANTEVGTNLVPYILRVHEGHFVQSQDFQLVQGVSQYPLPTRAAGSTATFIQLLDSSFSPLVWPNLQQEDMEFILTNPSGWSVLGQQGWYFFEGNNVVLNASSFNSSAAYIRFYFAQRVSEFVPTSSVGVITAATAGSGNYTVTVAALPTTQTFTTSTALECVNATPSFSAIALGVPTNITGMVLTFIGTLPNNISVGDSLCLLDQANFITWVPLELTFGLLDKIVAMNVAAINGDDNQAKRLGGLVTAAEKSCMVYLGKREQIGHRKISGANTRILGRRTPFYAK